MNASLQTPQPKEVLVPTYEMYQHLENRVRQLESLYASPNGFTQRPSHLTREEAARFLKISTRSLDRIIRQGELKVRREGPKQGKVLVEILSLCNRKEKEGFSRDHIETLLLEIIYGD